MLHGIGDLHDCASGEGPLSGEQLVKHAAERPDVRAAIDLSSSNLLRAHVGRRPDERSFAREISLHRGSVGSFESFGNAEVENLDAALRRDLHVRGLEIPMDHARFVRRFQSGGDVNGHPNRLIDRHRTLQGDAGNQLQDQEALAVEFLDSVDRGDVRMIE